MARELSVSFLDKYCGQRHKVSIMTSLVENVKPYSFSKAILSQVFEIGLSVSIFLLNHALINLKFTKRICLPHRTHNKVSEVGQLKKDHFHQQPKEFLKRQHVFGEAGKKSNLFTHALKALNLFPNPQAIK